MTARTRIGRMRRLKASFEPAFLGPNCATRPRLLDHCGKAPAARAQPPTLSVKAAFSRISTRLIALRVAGYRPRRNALDFSWTGAPSNG
jgi:hypothetical protein